MISASISGENISSGSHVLVPSSHTTLISLLLFLNLAVGISLIFHILSCGWEEVLWLPVAGGVGWSCGKLGVESGMLGRGWWAGVGFGVFCGLSGVAGLGGSGASLPSVDCVSSYPSSDGGSCRWALYVSGG